jgi:hypothetical protein
MSKHSHFRRSDLFLVRMWTEATDTGSRLAYGKVQRAVSGETNHFEDWEGLLERLRTMVANDKRNKQDKTPDDAQEE